MAEFSKVLKKRAEMCESYEKCKKCPLCGQCSFTYMTDHSEEFEQIVMSWEKPIDWSKVEVDTPILVSDNKAYWGKRYFAKYEDGYVWAWDDGKTSWTADGYDSCWKYAKLADKEENKC